MKADILDAKFKWGQQRPIEQKQGVNGPVITYYIPLEEVWDKYGKPGDLNGYEPSPMTGKKVAYGR